jgi:hypothetical protein
MQDLIQRFSNRKNFLTLLLAYCIYFPIFFFANVPFGLTRIKPYAAGMKILDQELFYTADQAFQRLNLFGEQGRKVYSTILMGDLVYPALLGLFLCVSITLLFRKLQFRSVFWRYLAFLPLANMLFDYLEDTLIFSLLRNFPSQMPITATTAGYVTFTKNMFGMLSFFVLGFALVALIIQWFKHRNDRPSA